MSELTSILTQQPVFSHPETPGHLFEQLDALTKWVNDEREPLLTKLARESDQEKCMVVLQEFYEHIIHSFPSPQEFPWPAIHEKIKLIEASFDVFALVGVAFCDAEDFPSFSRLFFLRVFSICHVLEGWIDTPDVSVEPGDPTPRELYIKGEQACVGLLRAWLGSMRTTKHGLRGWQVAQEMITECITSCQGTKGS